MHTPEILFVFPSILNGRMFEGFDYHLGAGYLRAYLRKFGIATEQFLGDGSATLREYACQMAARRPRIVGFSCYDNNYFLNKLLATEIKRIDPTIAIIFGGPAATFSSELILQDCSAVDVCGRSYCEETVLELVEWANKRKSLQHIRGIAYRDGQQVVLSPERELPRNRASRQGEAIPVDIQRARFTVDTDHQQDEPTVEYSLDSYPDPYTTGLIPVERAADIGFVSSRGCAFSCTFCVFSALSRRSLLCHSEEYVLAVLAHINHTSQYRGQKQMVAFNDDNFSMSLKRMHGLLRAIASKKFDDIRYWAEMRVDSLTEESLDLLQAAGFSEVNFGLESAVPEVLAAMQKLRRQGWEADGFAKEKKYVEKVAWAVSSAKLRSIDATVSVILGSPGETSLNGQQTIDFVEQLAVSSYAHNFLSISAGTALMQDHAKWGLGVMVRPWKVLPQQTSLTYDVYSLRILDNDKSWLPMSGFEMRQIRLIFSGLSHAGEQATLPRSYGRGGAGKTLEVAPTSIPTMLIDGDAVRESAAWLAKELPVATRLWIGLDPSHDKGEIESVLAKAGVPIEELNTMRRVVGIGRTHYRINELSITAPTFNTRFVNEYLYNNTITPEFRDRFSIAILDATQVESRPAFLGDSGLLAQSTWSIDSGAVDERVQFKDSCRWCSRECPVADGTRWLVNADLSVRPCHKAPAAGYVGEPLHVIEQRLHSEKSREEERRGCGTCEVRDVCSKCLYTAPLTPEEYCSVRKQKPTIASLFDGMHYLSSLSENASRRVPSPGALLSSCAAVGGGVISNGSGTVSLSGCVLIEYMDNTEAFLFNHQTNLALLVPPRELAPLKILLKP